MIFAIAVHESGAASFTPSKGNTASQTATVDPLLYFSALPMKEVQKLVGRKLKLNEKLAIKILQWKIKKGLGPGKENGYKDKGRIAMLFGILGIASLAVPVIGFFGALAFLILALVLGYQARRENPDNRNAKTAIVLGWITLGLLLLGITIFLLYITSTSLGWG